MGLWLWHRKVTERNKQEQRRIDLHTRLTMLQMDWTAMVMTGEKTGLYEKYIESSSQKSVVSSQNKSKSKKLKRKRKLTKKEMAEAIAKEKQMIAGLSGFFRGVKKQ